MQKLIAILYLEENEKTLKYLEYFQAHLSDFEVKSFENLSEEDFNTCEVAIVIDASSEQLQSFNNLFWVQSIRAGVEKLIGQLKDSTIQISRLVDKQLTYTMANSALAWVYYLQKNMYDYKLQQHDCNWNEIEERENEDTTIALLGLGELGIASANKLLDNDFKVSAWARSNKEVKNIQMYYGDDGLNEILKHADIVLCLLPLSPETTNLINGDKIKYMKKGASFINFARGPIVDYEALEQSINEGQIKHAVLDVFKVEPLEKTSSLWKNKNISILPHISAVTNIKTASKISANNIIRYYKEGTTPLFINKKLGY
jgi:glyoxylate/hydroxypyruvate reductase A